MKERLHTTVILAMTADGKISDFQGNPAHFSSAVDKEHLETQISLVDALLLGASTLRAYGTTLPITKPELLQARRQAGKPLQPVHIVCSASGKIDSQLRFFSQVIPRWLLTTNEGANRWQKNQQQGFEKIIIVEKGEQEIPNLKSKILNLKSIDWLAAFQQFSNLGIQKLGILGGGQLVASLLESDLIDELWLTVCPLLVGGEKSPTPVGGRGFLLQAAKPLELLAVEVIGQEIFLHYRRQRLPEKNRPSP